MFHVVCFTDWCKSEKKSSIAAVFGVTLTQDTCIFFFHPKTKIQLKASLVVFLWFGFLSWVCICLHTITSLHKVYLDESNCKVRCSFFFKLLTWRIVLLRWRQKLTGCCHCKPGSAVWSQVKPLNLAVTALSKLEASVFPDEGDNSSVL